MAIPKYTKKLSVYISSSIYISLILSVNMSSILLFVVVVVLTLLSHQSPQYYMQSVVAGKAPITLECGKKYLGKYKTSKAYIE